MNRILQSLLNKKNRRSIAFCIAGNRECGGTAPQENS